MIEGLVDATVALLAPESLLFIFLGVFIGLIVGVLPGMGGAGAVALLIPLTFSMGAEIAIGFLMAVGVTSGLGGQITSILVGIPGDPPNAATVIDGHPMTKQGRGAEALGAATFGSLFGAIFGMVALLLILPFARGLILAFSFEEMFMIMLSGLVLIAVLTRGNSLKGLVAAGVGLMISFIGLNPVNAQPRFDFGWLYLYDGVDVTPVLVGLFAGAEMLTLFSSRVPPIRLDEDGVPRISRFRDGLGATFRAWKVVLSSSVIGFVIGVVPGIGSTVGSFVSYGASRRLASEPEKYGSGAVEGVIACETANDADKAGALLPTLLFGIPGGLFMAVLAAGLVLHGVQMGPALFRNDESIVYVLIVATLLPRLIGVGVLIGLGNRVVALTRIRGALLAPVIVVVSMLAVYSLGNNVEDVLIAIIFSAVGYAMVKYDWSRVALVIALVLGGQMETSFYQALQAHGPTEFFTRPISLFLFIVSLALLFGPFVLRRTKRTAGPEAARVDEARSPEAALFIMVIVAFLALLVSDALGQSSGSRMFPLLVGIPTLIGAVVLFVQELRKPSAAVVRAREAAESAEADAAAAQADAESVAAAALAADDVDGWVEAANKANADDEILPDSPEARRLQVLLGVWAIGAFILGALVNFLIVVPIALLVIFAVMRERLLPALLTTAATTAFCYLVFVELLSIRL
jgi:putative tricarboxylic transport membrane protein